MKLKSTLFLCVALGILSVGTTVAMDSIKDSIQVSKEIEDSKIIKEMINEIKTAHGGNKGTSFKLGRFFSDFDYGNGNWESSGGLLPADCISIADGKSIDVRKNSEKVFHLKAILIDQDGKISLLYETQEKIKEGKKGAVWGDSRFRINKTNKNLFRKLIPELRIEFPNVEILDQKNLSMEDLKEGYVSLCNFRKLLDERDKPKINEFLKTNHLLANVLTPDDLNNFEKVFDGTDIKEPRNNSQNGHHRKRSRSPEHKKYMNYDTDEELALELQQKELENDAQAREDRRLAESLQW